MDLLEYQAKELFREVGIPILPSQTIQDPRQIKQLQIPYPVVLKSQVPSGGRGKAGGVRFVANTIDAIAAARTIFNLSILSEYPEVILAEAHYNSQQEVFLAIVLDYRLKCPVLLGSFSGGMNVKSLLANLQQIAVQEEFSPFYARRLISRMGLSKELISSVSNIIQKMYYLFQTKDLEKIEINPLGINSQGELMALDGKITVNDNALTRHPRIYAFERVSKPSNSIWGTTISSRDSDRNLKADSIPVKVNWLDWKEEKGKIAIICNNLDLAVLTWDLIQQENIEPACGVTIERQEVANETEDLEIYAERFQQILTRLQSIANLQVILCNIWEPEAIGDCIMENVALYYETLSQEAERQSETNGNLPTEEDSIFGESQNRPRLASPPKSPVKFVLRLLNTDNCDRWEKSENVYLTTSLKSAVSQAVSLVK